MLSRLSQMETDSEIGETFKLTQSRVSPRKSINAFSDELLNCQLCHSRFKNPKSLTCLHSFCETCLDIYIAKLPGGKNRFFPCPVCRELNPVPKPDQAENVPESEKWAPELPGESFTMTSRSRRSSVDEFTERSERTERSMALTLRNDRKCSPCAENDEIVQALYWCPTCREALCDMCTKSHRGMKITKSHALMDIDDLKERPVHMIRSREICPEHRGKLLDLYCQDHQCMVCNTCVAIHHRRCDTILAIDRVARTNRSQKTNKSLQQRLRHCINVVDHVLSIKEQSKARLITRKEGILDEVAKLKMSIIQLLDELEEKMKDEIDAVCRDYEDILQGKIDRSKGLRDSIQSALSTIQSTLDAGTDYQQVLATQTLKEEVEKYEHMADNERIDYKDVDLMFTADENLVRMAKMVDRMGYVEISEKREMSKPFRHCSAQKNGIINGKVKGDRNGCIFNSVDISDTGEIILSDFNNCCVKLFDAFGMFRSSSKLNSPPRGVSMLPDRMAAVALPEECVIKLMSVEGKFLSNVRELHTSFKAYRISNYRGKLVGILYSKACRSLSIIERNGRVEKTMTRKRDYKGLGGVAYDPVKNYIYMSDRDAISCYNGAGKQVFRNTYRRTDLRGMALDCQGNIYVCSHDSGQVLQISPDGTLIKSILVPISPQDVAIEPMGNKMVVVGLGEVVHVYNLV
ncbi:E3 ubiquitin/ISG15 ligase TRIM25-like [Mercenaria mercenaria]|uniref:E3 ubiquitin/ISG15 ligase TRIM25-like n=1 Tax=Mercenaria mercenaria TaxID=6596 RepID=UPI00234E7929|nr:E3 ubiquitin/ISG15 ligase TRIM25-like [Mercenaria mercenaria]